MSDTHGYDAIVIGAGHNGLTHAAYLAKAGQRVLVVGGGLTGLEAVTEIAEAGKEGGFLGIGGEAVSADEQAALGKIRVALGQ